ncbi:MAG TPA: spermidine synthase [Polyangia bacterium]
MRPWQTIDSLETPEGKLELRQRGERDFLITIGGRVLMTSAAHRSETALARLACAPLKERPRAQVLIGGLGMGYTLRAALDELHRTAHVTVVDLNQAVVSWCKGPLGVLTDNALADRRVRVVVADVARVIAAAAPGSYDAIVLDLYEGPHQATNRGSDPLYGRAALEKAAAALRPGGVLAIWSEEPDHAFEIRMVAAGFKTTREAGGRGGRAHVIYLGVPNPRRKPEAKPGPKPARPRQTRR